MTQSTEMTTLTDNQQSQIKELVRQTLREKELNDLLLAQLFGTNSNERIRSKCREILREFDYTSYVQPIVTRYMDQNLPRSVKATFFESCQPQIQNLVEAALVRKLSEDGFRQVLSEMESSFQTDLKKQRQHFEKVFHEQQVQLMSLTESEKSRHLSALNAQAEMVVNNLSSTYLRQYEDRAKQLETRMNELLHGELKKQSERQSWWNWGLLFSGGLSLGLVVGLGLKLMR
jgi:hypothetical protein